MVTQVSTNGALGFPSTYTNQSMGLDIIEIVQLQLVAEYNDQLADCAKMIKNSASIKKEIRNEIQTYNKIKGTDTIKIGDKQYYQLNDEQMEAFGLPSNPDELNVKLMGDYEYKVDEETGQVKTDLIEGSAQFTDFNSLGIKRAIFPKKDDPNTEIHGYQISEKLLDAKIENLNSKLENINEQSEMTSLKLQSLTNQRKNALETISNSIKKQSDAIQSIVQNLR